MKHNRVYWFEVVAALLAALCVEAPGPAAWAAPASSPESGAAIGATVVPGTGAYPGAPVVRSSAPRPGPITLNFPGVEVRDFAKAVLGDVLGVPYAVDPAARGVVSLTTPHPIARADVFPAIEDALKAANLALQPRGGVYTIVPLDAARSQAPLLASEQPGFGTEVLTLRFANPDKLRDTLDPVLPGVISATDPAARTLTLSGASGQRRAMRDLVAQFDVDWMQSMSFGLFVPRNTDARLIAPELEKLINAPGSTSAGLVRLVAMERLNGIIAIAQNPQYLEDVRRWVEVLDREGRSSERRLYVYRVQNGRAADLADVLVSAFGGAARGPSGGRAPARSGAGAMSGARTGLPASGGDQAGEPTQLTLPGQSPTPAAASSGGADALVVTADEANNAVVAYATPREYALIEDALGKLDITPLQVVIEAAITEVTLNDTLRYGTQWYLRTHGNILSLSESSTGRPTQIFPGASYAAIGNGVIGATLNALSTVTHVQVLSAPNLLVLNNHTASLQVGDQVPIATGSAISTTSADAPVVNSIEYRDTGVILKVTPRVNSSGLVLLDIAQEVSQVSPASPSNPIASPVIQERKIASSIAVLDGQTIALGGLISDNTSKGRGGVPLLSGIPLLGALVGNRSNTRTRTELLVLLSPRVIRSPAAAQAVTDDLRGKIRSVAPLWPKVEP